LLQAFQAPGEWLKGNLHTHTTNSDGRLSPEDRVAGYVQRGYDFLAFTDHNFVTRCPSNDLVTIPGSEHRVASDYRAYHLVSLNSPPGFQLFDGLAIQEAVDEVLSVGGLPIIAHPYWSGLTAADLNGVRGCVGVEIFNTTCHTGIGKGTSTVHWDDLLAAGWRGHGFAVDDSHFLSDAYAGWIMLKCPYREAGSIIDAIKAGQFYSSTGPEIRSVALDGTSLTVECSDAIAINFVGRACSGRRFAAENGGTINSASFELVRNVGYVRIEVTDALGRTAWTNPMYLS